jgi:hypothetical protein
MPTLSYTFLAEFLRNVNKLGSITHVTAKTENTLLFPTVDTSLITFSDAYLSPYIEFIELVCTQHVITLFKSLS